MHICWDEVQALLSLLPLWGQFLDLLRRIR